MGVKLLVCADGDQPQLSEVSQPWDRSWGEPCSLGAPEMLTKHFSDASDSPAALRKHGVAVVGSGCCDRPKRAGNAVAAASPAAPRPAQHQGWLGARLQGVGELWWPQG